MENWKKLLQIHFPPIFDWLLICSLLIFTWNQVFYHNFWKVWKPNFIRLFLQTVCFLSITPKNILQNPRRFQVFSGWAESEHWHKWIKERIKSHISADMVFLVGNFRDCRKGTLDWNGLVIEINRNISSQFRINKFFFILIVFIIASAKASKKVTEVDIYKCSTNYLLGWLYQKSQDPGKHFWWSPL